MSQEKKTRTRRSAGSIDEKNFADMLRGVDKAEAGSVHRPAYKDAVLQETIYKEVNSQQLQDDFSSLVNTAAGTFPIIRPPYNPNILKLLPEENNILSQCIEAYVENIENTGHTFVYVGEEGGEQSKEALNELMRLKDFVEAPNEMYSLTELRKRLRRDRETYGYGFIEVTRNLAGEVDKIYHVAAHTMAITVEEQDETEVEVRLRRNGEEVVSKAMKRFRRYVQRVNVSTSFFKEFGDPRLISRKDGRVLAKDAPITERATEILRVGDYRSGYIYGFPRWTNQLPSVLGSRESEVVNLEFFRDNAIPAMALLIGGGSLADSSVQLIKAQMERGKGRGSHNKILILEVLGDEVASDAQGRIPAPSVDIKPLGKDRQQDGLFLEYDNTCQEKIRSSFRLPPILVGMTTDYNRATADASVTVCESQVFQPERNQMDAFINRYILGDGFTPPNYYHYRSNPARIVDKADIIDSLDTFDQVGALTPNQAISIMNELYGTNVPTVESPWGDFPYSLSTALVARGEGLIGTEELSTPAPTPEAPANANP